MPADFVLRRIKTPLGYIPDPSIVINVLTKIGYVPFNFLVDSGADYTSPPAGFAERLGVKLDKSRPQTFLGMGKSSGKGYIEKIKIQITHKPIDVRCAFMEDDSTNQF